MNMCCLSRPSLSMFTVTRAKIPKRGLKIKKGRVSDWNWSHSIPRHSGWRSSQVFNTHLPQKSGVSWSSHWILVGVCSFKVSAWHLEEGVPGKKRSCSANLPCLKIQNIKDTTLLKDINPSENFRGILLPDLQTEVLKASFSRKTWSAESGTWLIRKRKPIVSAAWIMLMPAIVMVNVSWGYPLLYYSPPQALSAL